MSELPKKEVRQDILGCAGCGKRVQTSIDRNLNKTLPDGWTTEDLDYHTRFCYCQECSEKRKSAKAEHEGITMSELPEKLYDAIQELAVEKNRWGGSDAYEITALIKDKNRRETIAYFLHKTDAIEIVRRYDTYADQKEGLVFMKAGLEDATNAIEARDKKIADQQDIIEEFKTACKAARASDPDPCQHDHHGYCQTHNLESADKCWAKLIDVVLAAAEKIV